MVLFRVPRVVSSPVGRSFGVLLLGVPLLLALLINVAAVAESPKPSPAVRFVREWGRKGSDPGEFHFPIGIAVNAAGEVLVADFYNDRVQKFDPDGKLLAVIPVSPHPGGIAVDGDGTIFITHFGIARPKETRKPDQVTVHGPDGKPLRQWGKTGTGPGEFDMPGGVAVSPGGRVYVADQTNRRVQVFDRSGKFLFQWGEYGTGPGQFGGNVSRPSRVGGPQFVALDKAGNVYTTEGSVGRVQKFTADGKFLLAWGDNADKAGSFGGFFTGFATRLQGPVAVCLDGQDRVWVSAVSGRIQRFSNAGQFQIGFGREGTEPGSFYAPHGVAVDGRENLYVVDAYNHRIQKFAVER